MALSSPADLEARQREFLASLLALADLLAEAVMDGDLRGALAVSEQRGRLIAEAAAWIPPATPWAPAVHALAADVHHRTRQVQREVDDLLAEHAAAHGQRHTT